ncbi:alpha/beta fold hydrolase [Paenibacillus glycanilyticus]|uniref:3-oxoadipate enol-lactonase n=1 Tax=Paenibacillus glycanilyticus TaxID=126569 RepID=A0ABQ6G635_9BACL|nr:alpha/beta hydrolase [Paenibacillus glycanilyticus]GLX66436.1 3-oxoadipate enol-lactonase [Paenibacillus glycanilyticus]
MSFIQVRNIPFHYHIDHSNSSMETIVLIHDLGLNQEVWEPFLPHLKEHYRVVKLDLRGHGRTGQGHEPVSWELLIQDLFGFLTQLELGPVHLLGYGFGATLAVKFSLQHSDLVKSLVLLSVPAFMPKGTISSIIESRMQLTSKGSMLTLAESLANGISKLSTDHALYNKLVSAYMAVAPATYFQMLELFAKDPVNEDFAHLTHPTLVLVGADDSIYLTSNALSSQLLMHSTLIVVPDASNALFIDQPRFTFEEVDQFIKDPSAVKTDYASFECYVAKYVMEYFNDAFEQILSKKAIQA